MTKYKVIVTSTVVRKKHDASSGKNGNLKKGKEIEITKQEDGFGFTEAPIKGWVKMFDLSLVDAIPSDPLDNSKSLTDESSTQHPDPSVVTHDSTIVTDDSTMQVHDTTAVIHDSTSSTDESTTQHLDTSVVTHDSTTLTDDSQTLTDTANLYRALHGNERPDIGWLDTNLGSFDIIPLLPNPKLEKGNPLKLTAAQVEAIRKLNPDGDDFTANQKWNWLVDEEGNRDIMAKDPETGLFRIPSPGISGGAIVKVLSDDGVFAKIETLAGDIPDILPKHLVFIWYGFTKGGKMFTPFGGVKFPVLFSDTSAFVPLAWLEKL